LGKRKVLQENDKKPEKKKKNTGGAVQEDHRRKKRLKKKKVVGENSYGQRKYERGVEEAERKRKKKKGLPALCLKVVEKNRRGGLLREGKEKGPRVRGISKGVMKKGGSRNLEGNSQILKENCAK